MKISKLKELSKAGTRGPWSSGVLTDDTIMYFICERSKALKFNQDDFLSISKKECDSDLVVSMRNNFDALLEVAEAVKDIDLHWFCRCTRIEYEPVCDTCLAKKALKKLEEV